MVQRRELPTATSRLESICTAKTSRPTGGVPADSWLPKPQPKPQTNHTPPEYSPTLTSLTRIADFNQSAIEVESIPKSQWDTGDYVVCEVVATSRSTQVELTNGRMTEVSKGDLLIGAFGVRAATLEAVGHWNAIDDSGRLQAMTAAGLLGRITSQSTFIPRPIELQYRGHAVRGGIPVRMKDFVRPIVSPSWNTPILLLIGTSMSSGKTTSARVIIRRLKRMGLRVAGAKLTGAGRYRDILAMSDAGADSIFDFVDVGLPSTVCDSATYHAALEQLLAQIATSKPDVLVAEAGASPLEPYNGELAMEQIHDHIRCTVLCASDPYAVVGVTQGFGFEPDLVSGVATSTSAGVDVIRRLCGRPALNLLDSDSHAELDQLLLQHLMLDQA